MNDGIAARERARNISRIANIALDLPETGIVTVGGEDVSAVNIEIEDRHFVYGRQEMGDEARPDIAGATSNENAVEEFCH